MGEVREKFDKIGLKVPKMFAKETNQANFVSYVLYCPKQPKYHYHFISKSVFSLNALVEGGVGQMMTKADEGGKGGSSKC